MQHFRAYEHVQSLNSFILETSRDAFTFCRKKIKKITVTLCRNRTAAPYQPMILGWQEIFCVVF